MQALVQAEVRCRDGIESNERSAFRWVVAKGAAQLRAVRNASAARDADERQQQTPSPALSPTSSISSLQSSPRSSFGHDDASRSPFTQPTHSPPPSPRPLPLAQPAAPSAARLHWQRLLAGVQSLRKQQSRSLSRQPCSPAQRIDSACRPASCGHCKDMNDIVDAVLAHERETQFRKLVCLHQATAASLQSLSLLAASCCDMVQQCSPGLQAPPWLRSDSARLSPAHVVGPTTDA
eukprot:TRINITY_DN7534_c0_g1_i1.p1 TRINITY_DN7534_c0_g1~~TRINITY_DN7534_c0_g1_i1.p1  ORF type:complete len:235 (+),score=17.86 TRINITY_DN7534_c0_g1_i1:60-764(+)